MPEIFNSSRWLEKHDKKMIDRGTRSHQCSGNNGNLVWTSAGSKRCSLCQKKFK